MAFAADQMIAWLSVDPGEKESSFFVLSAGIDRAVKKALKM
jgi:hypothetical protein